jgi:hypothetical protein
MNTGALIYATDGDIAYTKIAEECASRVEKYLGISSTIVSGDSTVTGNRAWADCNKPVAWRNSGRCNALEDSPYDRTLLIDADYWIASDCLRHLLNADGNFYAHNSRMYINEQSSKIETFGTLQTPMWWATVCVFDSSEFSQDVFSAWCMIEDNYSHYANLFQFTSKPFRNDYALSMALLLVNGGEYPNCAIPWPLINVPDSCEIELENNKWTLGYTVYENEQHKPKRITVQDQDLHIMGKRNLEKLLDLQ